MSDRKKTKEQLLRRMILLGRRVAKLKNSATKRKRVEEALRESEERFRTIFEKATMGIGLTDLEGRILSVNPAFLRMLGYAGEEFTGKSFFEFTHADRAKGRQSSIGEKIYPEGWTVGLG
jgi:PAS domain-containing protein